MSGDAHQCECPCHRGTPCHHAKPRCTCGGGIVPPRDCRPDPCERPPRCPPPRRDPQPGTVDLPQTPPPHWPTRPSPPWRDDRPPVGDPGEVPWFRGKVGGISLGGPKFGPRKDEFLPFLLIRSAAGDRGRRPTAGVFWESPDLYVARDQPADTAPLLPPTLAGIAHAGAPNTLYAHVWNLGKAPASRVRVEFYWFNPSLGISEADANLIGAAYIDLQDRFSLQPAWRRVQGPTGSYVTKGSHAIVRCPVTWNARFENGGHECLVVRAFEPFLDALPRNEYRPYADRHVGQRNITVVQAASPAELDLLLDLGYLEEPSEVSVDLTLDSPGSMEWLRLLGADTVGAPDPAGVVAGLLPPTMGATAPLRLGAIDFDCRAPLLTTHQTIQRGCDPIRVGVHASARELCPREAQVVRVRQHRAGQVIGGYTVVLNGPAP